MTRDEGILLLEVWREFYVPKHGLDFSIRSLRYITSGTEYVYLNGLVDELEDRIRDDSEFDPVTEIGMYIEEMEEVLALSDNHHFITHRYCSFMQSAAHDILWFLIRKEKNMQYDTPETRKKKLLDGIQDELDRRGILCDATVFLG